MEDPEDKWDDRHQRQRDLAADPSRGQVGESDVRLHVDRHPTRAMVDILHVYFCCLVCKNNVDMCVYKKYMCINTHRHDPTLEPSDEAPAERTPANQHRCGK